MNLTQIVLALTVVLLIAYDILAILTKGLEATISWQVNDLGKKYPIITFGMGLVCGHFFWQI